MRVELTRNNDNKIVGYKMIVESEDDKDTIAFIRDMYFWGLDEQVITYDGRESDNKDNTVVLKFVKKWYANQEWERRKEEFKKSMSEKYSN